MRNYGFPKTDEERMARHKSIYGNTNLPPRGTGRKINFLSMFTMGTKLTPYHKKMIQLKIYGTYDNGRSVPEMNNWVDTSMKRNVEENRELGAINNEQEKKPFIKTVLPYAMVAFFSLNILKMVAKKKRKIK